MRQNRIIAVILLAFVMVWGYLTTYLPETTMIEEPGPKFFPFIILILMAFFSVLLFFDNGKRESPTELETESLQEEGVRENEVFPISSALKLFGVFFLGILMIYFLGFNVGMIIALSTMLRMIGWKLLPRAIVFSTVATLGVFFLFDWLLRIPLPTGILF